MSSGLSIEAPSPDCPIPVYVSSVCLFSSEGIGIPSITYRALLLPEIDLVPRITTFAPPPIPVDDALMLTPATLPLRALTKLASFTPVTSSAFTCWVL